MSRRARAAAFAAAAALCAGLAAGATGSDRDVAAQFGPLREVLVAGEPLPARKPLRAADLELRRIPESFVPPGALGAPAQAVGRRPLAPVPAGAYVLGSQLAVGEHRPHARPALRAGLVPVEITVQAAGALEGEPTARVDVVVTTEPGPSANGRTYVAAPGVELIELRAGAGDPAAGTTPGATGESWVATLAVTRSQALRLIQAESFARSIRLIGR